jgi:hypothetical protein
MQDLNISEEGVRKLLKNIKVHKATGPNEIAGSVFLPLLVRRCVGIRLSSLMVLPLASPVASLSGMTKISLV